MPPARPAACPTLRKKADSEGGSTAVDVVQVLLAAPEPHTAEGLTNAVARLVRGHTVPAGTKLPTVREVAAALHMSPTAVSGAWTTLSRHGVLRTEGRRGTFVVDRPTEPAAPRFWRASRDVGGYTHDLGTGVPDTDLLPTSAPCSPTCPPRRPSATTWSRRSSHGSSGSSPSGGRQRSRPPRSAWSTVRSTLSTARAASSSATATGCWWRTQPAHHLRRGGGPRRRARGRAARRGGHAARRVRRGRPRAPAAPGDRAGRAPTTPRASA